MLPRKYSIHQALLGMLLFSGTSCVPSTSTSTPSVSPEPSPIPSASAPPRSEQTPAPQPSASVSPAPTPIPSPVPSASPADPFSLDPQANSLVFTSRDRALSQQSSLQGLYVNEHNNGLIYWFNAAQGILQGKLIKDLDFEPERQFGSIGDFKDLFFNAALDAQGNGLFIWQHSRFNDMGPKDIQSLSSISFQAFQTNTMHLDLGAYLLHDLNLNQQGTGWVMVSQAQEQTVNVYRIPVLDWELERHASLPTVITLPGLFTQNDGVKGGAIESNGSGLLVLKDPQTHHRMVWTEIQQFQAHPQLTDLPHIPPDTSQAEVYLREGKGYITWDKIHFIPVSNYQPQTDQQKTLPLDFLTIGRHPLVDVSLNALGTGLAIWVEHDHNTNLRYVSIQKVENFTLVSQPYVMKWHHAGSEVHSVRVSINHNGDGYVSGLNNICEIQGETCTGGVRLDRQIWVRQISHYRPL